MRPHVWVFSHKGVNWKKEPVNYYKCSQCGFELWHRENASDFEMKIGLVLAFTLIDPVNKLANHPSVPGLLGATEKNGLHAVLSDDCDAYKAALAYEIIVDVNDS